MRRLHVTSAFILLTQFACAQAVRNKQDLDTLMQQLGKKFMDMPRSEGLSIGIYNNGNSNFYNFGSTGNDKPSTPTKHTIFEIGSITKTFASYLLARAAIENRLNLSDDIRKYIKGEYPNLEFAGKPIQLLHLANTTSGLPDWIPAEADAIKNAPPDSVPFIRTRIYGSYKEIDFFNALHRVKLDTLPGTKAKHSNGAAQLLAYILEKVYQMTFEKMIKQYILTPNGMDETFFDIPDSKKAQLAQGYNASGILMPAEFRKPYFRSMGGLQSSSSDLVKYIKLQLSKKDPITTTVHTHTVDIDVQTGKPVALLPDSLLNDRVYSIGMNWFKYRPEKRNTQIWSDGSTSGFCSYIVMYPGFNCGIVLLTNKSDEKTFSALPTMAYEIFKFLKPD